MLRNRTVEPMDTTAAQMVSADQPFHPPSGTITEEKNGATTAPSVVMKAELAQSYMAQPKMVLRSFRASSVKGRNPGSGTIGR